MRNDVQTQPSHVKRSSKLAVRDPGRLAGERRTGHSPRASLLQSFIEAAVLVFPVGTIDWNRLAGVQSVQRKRLEFVLRLFLRAEQTFEIRLDGDAFGLRFLAQP